MANISNCRAILYKFGNIRKKKQKPSEAETFGARGLKLQSIDGLLESRKFEKVKCQMCL